MYDPPSPLRRFCWLFLVGSGGKTDQNAHPHMDYGQRIALVHNGTINNAHELRNELESKGVSFKWAHEACSSLQQSKHPYSHRLVKWSESKRTGLDWTEIPLVVLSLSCISRFCNTFVVVVALGPQQCRIPPSDICIHSFFSPWRRTSFTPSVFRFDRAYLKPTWSLRSFSACSSSFSICASSRSICSFSRFILCSCSFGQVWDRYWGHRPPSGDGTWRRPFHAPQGRPGQNGRQARWNLGARRHRPREVRASNNIFHCFF